MNFFKKVGNAVGNAANNVKKGAENVGKTVKKGAENVGKGVYNAGKTVVEKTGEGAKNLGDGIGKATGLKKKNICKEEKVDPDHPYDENKLALSICSITEDDERNAMWCMEYFKNWECFPVQFMNDAYNNAFEKLKGEVEKMVDNPDEIQDDGKKMAIKLAVGKMSSEALKAALKPVIAAEIVKASIGGAVKGGGRRAAIMVVEKTATRMAASGAFQALSNPAVGVAAAAGEMAATYICEKLGFSDKRIATYAGLAGGLLAGIAIGACVGGPFGAAGGAAVAGIGWAVGQTVGALMRTGKGPSDNWAYLETGMVDDEITFGTYAGDDGIYAHTYAKKNLGCYKKDCFSAGNKQDAHFQVTVWDGSDSFAKRLAHFNHVNYRDTIYVAKINGKHVVTLCRGGFSDKPGTTERIVS